MIDEGKMDLDTALRYRNAAVDRILEASRTENLVDRANALQALNDYYANSSDHETDERTVPDPDRFAIEFGKTWLVDQVNTCVLLHFSEWRSLASQQVIELALAARRYQARTGPFPDRPEDLDGLVDADVWIQPGLGARIAFRAETDHVIFYQWCVNRRDDGGKIDRDDPKDWGIRIPVRKESGITSPQ